MAVDDGAEFAGGSEAGHQPGGDGRRHRQYHGIAVVQGHGPVSEIQLRHAAVLDIQAPEPVVEADIGAPAFEKPDRRIDEAFAQALFGDQGTAGGFAAKKGFPHHRRQQGRRPFLGGGVEDGDGDRFPETPKEGVVGAQALGHRGLAAGPGEPERPQVIDGTAARDPAGLGKDGLGQKPGIQGDRPPLGGFQVEEVKFRPFGSGQTVLRPDVLQVCISRPIAAEQQMVAVVDAAAHGIVLERPAAAAGMSGGFVQNDPVPGLDQADRRRKAGHAGADDMGFSGLYHLNCTHMIAFPVSSAGGRA